MEQHSPDTSYQPVLSLPLMTSRNNGVGPCVLQVPLTRLRVLLRKGYPVVQDVPRSIRQCHIPARLGPSCRLAQDSIDRGEDVRQHMNTRDIGPLLPNLLESDDRPIFDMAAMSVKRSTMREDCLFLSVGPDEDCTTVVLELSRHSPEIVIGLAGPLGASGEFDDPE